MIGHEKFRRHSTVIIGLHHARLTGMEPHVCLVLAVRISGEVTLRAVIFSSAHGGKYKQTVRAKPK